MHGQEQHVLLGSQAHQGCPDQGPLRQIETPSHLLPRQCLDRASHMGAGNACKSTTGKAKGSTGPII